MTIRYLVGLPIPSVTTGAAVVSVNQEDGGVSLLIDNIRMNMSHNEAYKLGCALMVEGGSEDE